MIKRLNPFTVIATDTDRLTGEDWNRLVERLEKAEQYIEDKEREADLRKQLESMR